MIQSIIRSILVSSIALGVLGCSSGAEQGPNGTGGAGPSGGTGSSGEPGQGGTGAAGAGGVTGAGGDQSCPPVLVYGVVATVTDRSTGTKICDATVVLKDVNDPSYMETLRTRGTDTDCRYDGARERAGTYKLEASKSGYQSASVDVTVTQSGTTCKHVVGQNPSIELAPL